MISYVYGIRQWLLTLLAVAAVLAAFALWAPESKAGWIYDVDGIMAPAIGNPVSASFTGEIEFPTDLSTHGELRINLTNEFDLNTGDPIIRTAPFEMSANLSDPIGTRIFNGTWDEQPFAMQWMDWEQTANESFDSGALTDGGGWDAIGIGFHDYPLGSITAMYNQREVPQVNEPAGLALAAMGGIFLLGMLRHRR